MPKKSSPKPKKSRITKTITFDLICGEHAENGATPWYTKIGLGTPYQSFKIMLDTGTENTWLTDSDCKSSACKITGRRRFRAYQSDTHREITKIPHVVEFGPWGSMEAKIATDHLTFLRMLKTGKKLAGCWKKELNFLRAVHYTGCQFRALNVDGGIAIPGPYWEEPKDYHSLLKELSDAGEISAPVASFSFPEDLLVGKCKFGGYDKSAYKKGTLQWVDTVDVSGFPGRTYPWVVEWKGMTVGDKAVKTQVNFFVIDTGSSIFKGSKQVIDPIIQLITDGGKRNPYVENITQFSDYPDIKLKIGKKNYLLKPDQYFVKLNDEYWQLGFEILAGFSLPVFIAGTQFLETVYSIFDLNKKQIGLALPV